MNMTTRGLAAAAVLAALAVPARAEADKSIESIEQYREALRDGNPAELFEAQGEELWKKPAGPKNVSLEQCDLGLGAGVVKGAFAQLPRYFKDADKVQDAESRLLTCKEKLQGIDPATIVKAPFGSPERDELQALVTYISGASKDMPMQVSLAHAKEQAAYNVGRRLFYYQGGPHDFACATCHSQEGSRIRMQELPPLTSLKGAASAAANWPAYRVSTGQMWSMEWRLTDCLRQQRFPEPNYGSDANVALTMFMAVNANGATVNTPGIKR
jgi:sulfur-oxidizing protein SoxA